MIRTTSGKCRRSPPEPALPTVEAVLTEYAATARTIYERQTAGDYTWLGLLWCFMDELDKARAHERKTHG